MYDLKIPGLTRARQGEIVRALNASGIAARHSFLPMSQQEEYRSCRLVLRPDGRHRASEAAECVFYLPVVPGVTTRETVRLAFEVIYTALG